MYLKESQAWFLFPLRQSQAPVKTLRLQCWEKILAHNFYSHCCEGPSQNCERTATNWNQKFNLLVWHEM